MGGGGSTVHFPLMGPFSFIIFSKGVPPFAFLGFSTGGTLFFIFAIFKRGGPGPPPESATGNMTWKLAKFDVPSATLFVMDISAN